MTEPAPEDFTRALSAARDPGAAYDALHRLTDTLFGARLFTVMTVDMDAMLARRAYTSDPESYPTSGTKPVEMNAWFEVVHGRHECFVANTLAEIAEVFPDHALIGSLGCGSVVNLPVILRGDLVATVNALHEEGHYAPDRVASMHRDLTLPALAAVLVERTFLP
jgi:hypothetical protein